MGFFSRLFHLGSKSTDDTESQHQNYNISEQNSGDGQRNVDVFSTGGADYDNFRDNLVNEDGLDHDFGLSRG